MSNNKLSLNEIYNLARENVLPSEYLSYAKYLEKLYRFIHRYRKQYSITHFSEEIGFSASNMAYHIFNGDRALTTNSAKTVADKLKLANKQKKYFLTLVTFVNEKKLDKKEEILAELIKLKKKIVGENLDPNQVEYFTSWLNPIVKEMAKLEGFKPEAKWIKEKLGFPVSLPDCRHALETLKKVGYLDASGKVNKVGAKTKQTPGEIEEIRDLLAISYHQQMLNLSKQAVDSVRYEDREIDSMTACLSESSIKRLKQMIRDFLEQALELEKAQDDYGRHVVQLNIQMFKTTK